MKPVTVSGVSKAYGKKKLILKNIDFDVVEGTCAGLIGPNGAGKTTLIKIVAGLIQPTSGEVKVFGKNPFEDSVKSRIGYMPERPEFFEEKTVKYHLEFFARLRGIEVDCDEILSKLDLDSSKKARELSKGMRKKLSLALAVLHDPDLLILDEPTAGLDPQATVTLHEIVREAVENGKTVLLSTHNLYEVDDLCDRVIFINRGKLYFNGPIHELATSAVLRLQTSNNTAAIELLRKAGVDAQVTGKWVAVNNKSDIATILDILTRNGVDVLKMESRKNLYEVFGDLKEETG
ncbi:ABC transporter ATP-binding protein [Archaeoglobus veneficus]|uniref:Phosphonate-transporting ATPase n=1 Tax=Archaeoglobus veneficus (strain DSM 11195 / SNP6) TaxID=693661 RepID=F2KNY1_ARCVS|nr:ABC transporter ATP-binding protein [Archaeoglobus veneficus]AEA46289.1 Phosphonate-transporting ATPase [Archaeoglobus veneficus SNP6]